MEEPSLASRAEVHLRQWSWWLFAALLLVALFVKSGVFILRSAPEALATFPTPQDNASALSFGTRSIARLLGWEFPETNIVITAVGTILALVVVFVLLRPSKFGLDGRLVAILIVLGPIGALFITRIGGHDVWVIGGGIVLGILGTRYRWAIVGTAIMILGNPEQAVLATGVYVIATFTTRLADRRRAALLAFALAIGTYVGLALYARSVGVSDRSGYLLTYLGSSLYNFGANLPLSVYAGLGVTWIVVIWLLVSSSRRDAVLIVLSVVLIPFSFTAITLDQTRVFVGISTATVVALLLVAVPAMRQVAESRGFTNVTFWTLVTAVFLPSIVLTYTGTVLVPHGWFFVWFLPSVLSVG